MEYALPSARIQRGACSLGSPFPSVDSFSQTPFIASSRVLRYVNVLSLLLLFHCSICIGAPSQLTPQEQGALTKGEVLVENVRSESGIAGLRLSFLVAAPREEIWRTLLQYDKYTSIFPNVRHFTLVHGDDQGAKVRISIRVAGLDFEYILYRHYEKPGYRLTWRRLEGDLRRIEGRWEIYPTDNRIRQLVVHESFVDVALLIPSEVVRSLASDDAVAMAEHFRHWIESRHEVDKTDLRELQEEKDNYR